MRTRVGFLDAVPRATLFRDEIVVPVAPAPTGSPAPTATEMTVRDRCIDRSP